MSLVIGLRIGLMAWFNEYPHRYLRKLCKLRNICIIWIICIINVSYPCSGILWVELVVKVTATEFQRNFGRYEDTALVEPVTITRHGREKVVLLSKEAFDKMSARAPKAILVSELSDDDLRNIKQAKVPEEYAGLDNELP